MTQEAKAMVSELVEDLVTCFVDNEDAAKVEVEAVDTLMLFKVTVAPGDFGKLLGRHGANVQALRLLVRAWGRKNGLDAYVKVIDPQGNEFRIPDPEMPETAPGSRKNGSKPGR